MGQDEFSNVDWANYDWKNAQNDFPGIDWSTVDLGQTGTDWTTPSTNPTGTIPVTTTATANTGGMSEADFANMDWSTYVFLTALHSTM
jgi:hypothetical protein